MNQLTKISWILGSLLLGVSAVLMSDRSRGANAQRRREEHPIEELAESLKQAWAGHHIP
jgi:hypothetical protein